MHEGLRIAVVIPTVHADFRLMRLIASLPPMVDEVIVVDDGPDAVSHMDAAVRIVKHDKNRGVGAATMTGWEVAAKANADVAVVMAADGQMDPADLQKLLEPISNGDADFVKGDRLSHPKCPRAMPFIRRMGNYCLTFLTRLVAWRWDIMDSQCGYTAIRLDMLRRLPLDWLYPRYGFPNDLLVAVSAARLRLAQVVVTPVYNGEPSGLRPFVAVLLYPFLLLRGLLLRLIIRWRCKR